MHFQDYRKRRTTERLARLMEGYESNYLSIRLLVPALATLDKGDVRISRVDGCVDLKLEVLEKEKYTTTLRLTYVFDEAADKREEPDLTIRVYHDARTAEAMSGLIHGRRHEQRRRRDLDEGWVLNRFLHKWIRYCLHRGHRFDERSDAVAGTALCLAGR
ncbi:DUF1249 domain-containing protein [Granulosicoccaceae sp. 1_MG-2023]|nr:DUF1249 domain-containing protein [Granulosicoccaceae sp. 1_MG-2023]